MSTKPDGLTAAVGAALTEYADGIQESLQDAIKKAAAAAKKTLVTTSPRSSGRPSLGKKHYADQWAVKDTVARLSFSSLIYNKAPTYRLAHLLEHGYTSRTGKRVAGRTHIKPVEDKAIDEVTDAIERAAK